MFGKVRAIESRWNAQLKNAKQAQLFIEMWDFVEPSEDYFKQSYSGLAKLRVRPISLPS